MTLALIGNTIIDRVYRCDEYPVKYSSNKFKFMYQRKGGIDNISRRLRPTIPVTYYPTELCDAIILLHGKGVTSIVDWQRSVSLPKEPMRWAHISYLDKLDIDVSAIEAEFVSADLSGGMLENGDGKKLMENLKHVDWLIIGTDEVKSIGAAHMLAPQNVIVRRKQSVEWHGQGEDVAVFPNEWLEVLDPIGAGDAFVAEFLNIQMCESDNTFEEIIARCVEASLEYLRSKNG